MHYKGQSPIWFCPKANGREKVLTSSKNFVLNGTLNQRLSQSVSDCFMSNIYSSFPKYTTKESRRAVGNVVSPISLEQLAAEKKYRYLLKMFVLNQRTSQSAFDCFMIHTKLEKMK